MERGEVCDAGCVGGHRRVLGGVDATHPDDAEGLASIRIEILYSKSRMS